MGRSRPGDPTDTAPRTDHTECSVSIIHTGDTHIGYQQYHRPERRQDFLDAFEQVIEHAIAEDVDAVVHAGDLYHDRQPSLGDILGTLSVLRRLADHDIPFLAVVGNHESKRTDQWLDLFESLGLAVRLGRSPYVIGSVAFYGLDFVPRSQRSELGYEFDPTDQTHAVLVTHGLFMPFDYGDWDATEILDASTVSFEAMLLGDNHKPDQTEIDGTLLTYCGSTERASATEREKRGYNIVDFDEQGVHLSRRGLETRDFVFEDIDLAPGEGEERVTERLGQRDLTDTVCIVTIDGAGDPITTASIETFAEERGALVARVTDRREQSEDEEITVTFADPDDAVRERVRELGLSVAAQDIDETVRSSTVSNNRVANEVEQHVSELIEEGEDSVFEPGEPPESESESDESELNDDSPGDEQQGDETAQAGQSTMGEFQ